MIENEMSKGAILTKRHYYNVERWENKAKKIYGKKYEPAKDGEDISAQALALRREYGRVYRKKHKDMFRRATVAYWERKAKLKNQ